MALKVIKFSVFCTIILFYSSLYAHDPVPRVRKAEFVENKGQWDPRALFRLQLGTDAMFLEKNALNYVFFKESDAARALRHPRGLKGNLGTFTVAGHVLRVEFEGANPHASADGGRPASHYYNYYLGNDSRYWASGVKPYGEVVYSDLYPGTHLKLYATEEGAVKYDVILEPGADPANVVLHYKGAESLRIKNGYLYIKTSLNTLLEQAPYAYQLVNGRKEQVRCRYVKKGALKVGFELGKYDPGKELVIDPLLIFSTYSGSTEDNFGAAGAYDSEGNLYAGGITTGLTPGRSYPVTPGAFQQTFKGGSNTFPQEGFRCDLTISKYNNDGTALHYATYLGGRDQEYMHSMIVDKNNQLIVFANTRSDNFPVTGGAYDTTFNGLHDIVVTKFAVDGTRLIGSTYVGGSGYDGLSISDTLCVNYMDHMRGEVLVDTSGNIVVGTVTRSTDFPAPNGFQAQKSGGQDGCIFMLDSGLTLLKWGTFFGDTLDETLNSIELLADGTIYAVGGTHSRNIPAAPGVYDSTYHGGGTDGYIARVSADGTTLEKFMYWGSPGYDQCFFVKSNILGDVYVFGQHFDSLSITPGVFFRDSSSMFISSFTRDLDSLRFSTSIGNGLQNNSLSPSAFMVDICGNIYGSMWAGDLSTTGDDTDSTGAFRMGAVSNTFNMPVTPDGIDTTTDGEDFYIFALTPKADSLLYGTYYGETGTEDHVDGGTSRFDRKGIIYQSVCASCNRGVNGQLMTTPGSFSPKNLSPRCSNASMKLDFRKSNLVIANFDISPRNGCGDSIITFTNTSYNGKHYRWYLDGVLKDTTLHFKDTLPLHSSYEMKLIAIDSSRCIIIDSITKKFEINIGVVADFDVRKDSCSPKFFFTNKSTSTSGDTLPCLWRFGDGSSSTLLNPEHTYNTSDTFEVMLITNVGKMCSDTLIKQVVYDAAKYFVSADFAPEAHALCEDFNFPLKSTGIGGKYFFWTIDDTLRITHDDSLQIIDPDSSIVLSKGPHKVKLVVIDSSALCKIIDSIERTYYMYKITFPSFTSTRDSCDFTLKFTNTTVVIPGDSVNYLWLFGDDDSSRQKDPTHTFLHGGPWNVTLIANPDLLVVPPLNCIKSFSSPKSMDTLSTVLVSNFSLTPTTGCIPAVIHFKNLSVNGTKFYWYIDSLLYDSTPGDSLSRNFLDTFTVKKTISVMLVGYDSTACVPYDTMYKTIDILSGGNSDFELTRDSCLPALVIKNNSVSFGPDSLTYEWQFSDGTGSTLREPVFNVSSSGSYTATLITFPGTACADTSTRTIQYDSLDHIIKADFSLSETSFCLPSGTFDATNTSTNSQTSKWYFNDTLRSSAPDYQGTVLHTGIHKVKLVITDTFACAGSDSVEKTVMMLPAGTSDFDLLRDSCTPAVKVHNKSVTFSTDSLVYDWLFTPTGFISNIREPVPPIVNNGVHKARLIIFPGTICADTTEKEILYDSTRHLIIADFSVNDSFFCLPGGLKATNTSLNSKNALWYLDNRFESDSFNFSKIINEEGEHTVMLIAIDSFSCQKKDTIEKKITTAVNSSPEFDYYRDSCSLVVYFKNRSISQGTGESKYRWSFGDGDTSSLPEPFHSYKGTDLYTIRLVTNPGTNCSDSIEKTIYIDGDTIKEYIIPNVFTPNNDGFNDCYIIKGLTKCDDVHVEFYNRWGQIQYTISSWDDCWDGRNYLGNPVANGVYYYIMRVKKPDGTHVDLHGDITIIRD